MLRNVAKKCSIANSNCLKKGIKKVKLYSRSVNYMLFSEKLKLFRTSNGLTQEELAEN